MVSCNAKYSQPHIRREFRNRTRAHLHICMAISIKSIKEFPMRLRTSLLMSFINKNPRSHSAVAYGNATKIE